MRLVITMRPLSCAAVLAIATVLSGCTLASLYAKKPEQKCFSKTGPKVDVIVGLVTMVIATDVARTEKRAEGPAIATVIAAMPVVLLGGTAWSVAHECGKGV